jgi:hypothetical protein
MCNGEEIIWCCQTVLAMLSRHGKNANISDWLEHTHLQIRRMLFMQQMQQHGPVSSDVELGLQTVDEALVKFGFRAEFGLYLPEKRGRKRKYQEI